MNPDTRDLAASAFLFSRAVVSHSRRSQCLRKSEDIALDRAPRNGIQREIRIGDKMSIAMERFGSNEEPSESRASSASGSPTFPYRLQCRTCGFEPEDAITPPLRCPKCLRSAWERFAIPRSLLLNTDQYAGDSAGHSYWP